MKVVEQLFLLERMDGLIRRRQTGSPKAFAERLCISQRTLFRLISDLRDMGFEIAFSKQDNTYYYKEDPTFQIRIVWKEKKSIEY